MKSTFEGWEAIDLGEVVEVEFDTEKNTWVAV
jgi:hypothetical protein